MKATAVSRIVRIIGVTTRTEVVGFNIPITNPLNRDMSKCPAVMLAVSRTHSVIGRIMILTVSTRTMKFIKGAGVPCGVM